MPRKNYNPKDWWEFDVDIPWTMAMHCNDMIVFNPQLDEGNLYDLKTQTVVTVEYIKKLLEGVNASEADITNLRVQYVNDGSIDEDEYCSSIAKLFPEAKGATVDMVPFKRMVLPGLMVEICTYAMLHQNGKKIERQQFDVEGLYHPGGPFAHGLRAGKMIYVGTQLARDEGGAILHPGDLMRQSEIILNNMGKVLERCGASFEDVVRLNVFYPEKEDGTAWMEQSKLCASYFKGSAPAMTAIPLPQIYPEGAAALMCCWAMIGEDGSRLEKKYSEPEGHWIWPEKLPWPHGIKCEDMVFVGGQASMDNKGIIVDPGDQILQTKRSMENINGVLNEFGMNLQDVLKTNSYYILETQEEFEKNLAVRETFFKKPGPGSVGLPLDGLRSPGMMINVEAIAMQV